MSPYPNSIFLIDVEKIDPNPYQPRKEFEDGPLRDLSDSIRQYGVLQPLVVSRSEFERPDGMGLETRYELIAGERRLRASKLAGIKQVPVIIREGDDDKMKLELAIIENLQREDLNAVDRARAFMRLIDEFNLTHAQVGLKMGKSREYVSNSLRILQMSQEILDALQAGKINEGHTRPLMMLASRPEEQQTLFKEIVYKKLSVREAERIARRIAVDRVRKHELLPDANVMSMEDDLEERLGTRVHIQRKADGGKITIDFFSDADLDEILQLLKSKEIARGETMLTRFERERGVVMPPANLVTEEIVINDIPEIIVENIPEDTLNDIESIAEEMLMENNSILEQVEQQNPIVEFTVNNLGNLNSEIVEDIQNEIIAEEVKKEEEEDLYNISNFSL